ncbi:winged helix-turn-helix domain-containing protein [Pseudomonas sp.]|uniref:winged helix-turn-helix domain-containing protein n=1 Tax=Pseudomonas sp. TaxID=306 RepID=UPI003FD7EA48
MSALKKHLSTATTAFIVLPDFASNTELLYDDIACPSRANPEEHPSTSPATSTPSLAKHYFNQRCANYPAIEKFNNPHIVSTPEPYNKLQPYNNLGFKVQLRSVDRHQKTLNTYTEKPAAHAPDFWTLTHHDRMLVKGGLRISLTTIESALIKKMLHHEERVVSKEELIRNIGREPELYRGLEMCLSRLQDKFRRVNDGERLFRSVRNRGYCLTQKIKNTVELSQQCR